MLFLLLRKTLQNEKEPQSLPLTDPCACDFYNLCSSSYRGAVDFNPGCTWEHGKTFKYAVPRSILSIPSLTRTGLAPGYVNVPLVQVMMGSGSCKVVSHPNPLPHCRSHMSRDGRDIPFPLVTGGGSLIGKTLHFQSQKYFYLKPCLA